VKSISRCDQEQATLRDSITKIKKRQLTASGQVKKMLLNVIDKIPFDSVSKGPHRACPN
jgi:hypothetical protein